MIKLSEVPTGSIFILEQIPEETSLYKILMAYGIYRGTRVRIIRNDRWQNMILADVEGKRVAIRKGDVKSIEVTLIQAV
jgi:Fe2+ transport system protein FeoA